MPLFARSPEECHLYMELHPCDCGQGEFAWTRHVQTQRDGQTLSRYEGACGRCGTHRSFDFAVAADPPVPPAYGDGTPSEIIDPGEFLASSQRCAEGVPSAPARVAVEYLHDAHDALDLAVAGVVEVLKFIPAGAPAVPAGAFRSEAGRALYDRDPARFAHGRLAAELAEYQRIRAAYAAAIGE